METYMAIIRFLFGNTLEQTDPIPAPEADDAEDSGYGVQQGSSAESAVRDSVNNALSPESESRISINKVAPENAIPGEPYTCYSWSDTSETTLTYTGKSWVITQKDVRSGKIERFTQSGTGASGMLETIQGRPAPASDSDALNALKRKLFAWEGVEDRQPAQTASRKLVPLPRNMWEDVAGTILSSPKPMGSAFENLLPDSVRAEMAREAVADAARLNATTSPHRGAAPAHAGVPNVTPH
jgi:hypothetical protein